MAHFLEHMLFLGTAKYPDENEFGEFLSCHNGDSNAYTSESNTNYHFEIATKYFHPALDRFAQFFIHPLFTIDATDREITAVDSEFQKGVLKDSWRLEQLTKPLCTPPPPSSRFGFGNRHTLKEAPDAASLDVRAALLAL